MPDPVAAHSLMEHSLGELLAIFLGPGAAGAGSLYVAQWARDRLHGAKAETAHLPVPEGWTALLQDVAGMRADVERQGGIVGRMEAQIADLHSALPGRADLVAIGEERARTAQLNERIAKALEALRP